MRLILSQNSFTAAAAVGTVQVRSLVEPIRKIIARLRGHFVAGKAVDLVMTERLVEVETTTADGSKANIYIPCVQTIIILCSGYLNDFQIRQIDHCCGIDLQHSRSPRPRTLLPAQVNWRCTGNPQADFRFVMNTFSI